MIEVKELIDITKHIVKRRARKASDEFDADIVHAFMSYQEGLSPITAMNEDNIKNLWATIRRSEKVTKFVLDGAAELFFLCGLDDKGWGKVLDNLAYSLSIEADEHINRVDTMNRCVVDTTIRERVTSAPVIRRFLGDNKWLVFVIFMTMCPIIYHAKLNTEDYQESEDETV